MIKLILGWNALEEEEQKLVNYVVCNAWFPMEFFLKEEWKNLVVVGLIFTFQFVCKNKCQSNKEGHSTAEPWLPNKLRIKCSVLLDKNVSLLYPKMIDKIHNAKYVKCFATNMNIYR